MNSFDKIIGYEEIKKELSQIVDMIRNPEVYRKIGAVLPKGLLISGAPGLGKTLMAECLISECHVPAFRIRKKVGGSEFLEEISEKFRNARSSVPSIVFLDDMDKYADGENGKDEYTAIQAGIDETRDKNVFVIATVNDSICLPESLIRPGRFDRKIEVNAPEGKNAEKIVSAFLSEKAVSEDVDLGDIAGAVSYRSCAELETIFNEAAIRAAFARKEKVGREEILYAVLRTQCNEPESDVPCDPEKLKKTAIHEAGHLVVSEVLERDSVGLCAAYPTAEDEPVGFVRLRKKHRSAAATIMSALGGKAASELYYTDGSTEGCSRDISRVAWILNKLAADDGAYGFGLVTRPHMSNSEVLDARSEAVVHAEMERYLRKAREILIANRNFLELVTGELLEKRYLLASDIRRLREEAEGNQVVA